MRKLPHHSVPWNALRPALATPRIILANAALDRRPIQFDRSADGLQAELIKTAERAGAGRGEGSVKHVEVFRMVSVGNSILGDLDAYPATATRTRPTPSIAKSN